MEIQYYIAMTKSLNSSKRNNFSKIEPVPLTAQRVSVVTNCIFETSLKEF